MDDAPLRRETNTSIQVFQIDKSDIILKIILFY
jgi:hypothetical protein